MKVDFRSPARQLYSFQDLPEQVGTNVAMEIRLGVPSLEVKNGFLIAVLLIHLTADAMRLGLGWALDGAKDAQHLPPLLAHREKPEGSDNHACEDC